MSDKSPLDAYYLQRSPEQQAAMDEMFNQKLQLVNSFEQTGPVGQTKAVHSIIDGLTKTSKVAPGKKISCTKGCSFCCHIFVAGSPIEAEILSKHVKPEHIPVLEKQAAHDNATYPQLNYTDRKCVFLNNGECSVYSDRPTSCRKYFVVSDPDKCNTLKNPSVKVLIHLDNNIEITAAALFAAQSCDSMAKQLLEIYRRNH